MDGYMSAQDAARRWNLSPRQVQKMCFQEMIPGVARFGRSWVIPKDAEKPTRTLKTKPGPRRKADEIQEI